jgi:hypothetical protein
VTDYNKLKRIRRDHASGGLVFERRIVVG